MSMSHSAVSGVIRAVLDDPGVDHVDLFRELLRASLQDLIAAE